MTKIGKIFALAITFSVFLTSSFVFATDLKNMDNVTYKIQVETENGVKTITVKPKQVIKNICSNCFIAIEDTESEFIVDDEDTVFIKDGKIIVQVQEEDKID